MATPDQKARDAARLSLDANVVVEAGAGTGKTTLLTDRLLFLLLGGPKGKPLPISEIVALTFTEKAAGEIKLRLSDRLAELAALLAGEPLHEEARERAERTLAELKAHFVKDEGELLKRARASLEDLDKAQIGTIHSFAAHLLRLYPVQAGVDPGFSVDEGENFEELFASEWARWLDGELGERPPRAQSWLEILALCQLSDLESLAKELCGERLDLSNAGEADRETADWLDRLAKDVEALPEGQPAPKGRSKIKETLVALAKHLHELAAAARNDEPRLAAVRGASFTSSWPKDWDADREPIYDKAVAIAESASAASEALVRRACRLILPFARAFRRTYTRRGLVSFDGLLLKARDLVRDHHEVREELKGKFAALLIDEFQDTDPLQGELLLFLAEAPGRRATNWTELKAGAGRLFVVGDPKQSIYRFRGADISAYQSFTRHVLSGPGAVASDLQTNFRSPAEILEPVNRIFETLMVESEGLQAAHKRLEAGRAGAAGSSVEFVSIGAPGAEGAPYDAAAVSRAESHWIASWIISQCGPGKKFLYKDVAVLLRASTPLPALLDEFKTAGIPYAVELERHFYGAQEVLDFLNILRALDDPGDRAALAGVLRSPLGGLDDRGLYELAKSGAISYLRKNAKPAAHEPLMAALRSLRARVGRVPLGELVHGALQETRLLELSAAAYHGQQSVSNLLKLARLAAEASGQRGETLREFIERISLDVQDSGREGESPLADEHLDAVRVLTIHKAKGLEFPVVFLTNAASGRRNARKEGSLFDWASLRLGLRLGSSADARMARLEAAEAARQDEEAVRLLYVAMTRAKERLIIVGKEKGDKNAFTSRLARAGVWPAGGHGVSARLVPVDAARARPQRAVPARKAGLPSEKISQSLWSERARRRDEALGKPWTATPTDYLKEAPKARPRDENAAAPSSGARIGQLCHKVLQGWDFGAAGDLPSALGGARGVLERLDPSGDWDGAGAEAQAVLESFLASKTARDLAAVEILGRELPFALEKEGAVLRGSIDLLYRSKGRLVVADYKTDRVAPKEAKTVKARYSQQGAAYCAAVERAMNESPVEFRLIFLRAPEL